MTRDEFFARCEQTPTCWLWRGAVNSQGYGAVCVDGQESTAHRYAYALIHGPVPAGMAVVRTCGSPLCVRPDHLVVGKQGTATRYTANAKLTIEAVREIRARAASTKITQKEIGQLYNIAGATVSLILRGRIWADPGNEATYRKPKSKPRRLRREDMPEVLRLAGSGTPVEEIARRFNVTILTVATFLTRASRPPEGV